MKNILCLFGLCLLLGGLGFVPGVRAAGTCTPTMNEAVVNFNNYSITDYPGMPAGSQLSGAILGQETRSFFNCSADVGPVTMRFKASGSSTKAPVAGIAPNGDGGSISLYNVPGIPGVGFAVGVRETTHCAGDPVHYIGAGSDSTDVCHASGSTTMATQFFVVFYKTAASVTLEQPNSGQIYAGTIELVDSSGQVISGPGLSVQVAAADLKVHQASCYASDTDITVNLQQSSVSDFNNGGSGTKHGFSIPLVCDANQNKAVKIGFFGPSVKDKTGQDALSITKEANSANGVGIRITYGDNYGASAGSVVPINNTGVNAFPEKGATLNLQYNAQYVATGDQVTAGEANGLATFSIIYN